MPSTENKELIFVYNADSSLFTAVTDFARKAAGGNSCNLCGLTHGVLGKKGEWKEFLDTLPQKKTFLHRDEFRKKHPELAHHKLPAVFKADGNNIGELVGAEEINLQKDTGVLILLIKNRSSRSRSGK